MLTLRTNISSTDKDYQPSDVKSLPLSPEQKLVDLPFDHDQSLVGAVEVLPVLVCGFNEDDSRLAS